MVDSGIAEGKDHLSLEGFTERIPEKTLPPEGRLRHYRERNGGQGGVFPFFFS
mgnify:CR=1 FL=1